MFRTNCLNLKEHLEKYCTVVQPVDQFGLMNLNIFVLMAYKIIWNHHPYQEGPIEGTTGIGCRTCCFFFAGETFAGYHHLQIRYFKTRIAGCSFASGEDRKKLAGKVQCLDGPLQVMEFLKALSNTLGHGIWCLVFQEPCEVSRESRAWDHFSKQIVRVYMWMYLEDKRYLI